MRMTSIFSGLPAGTLLAFLSIDIQESCIFFNLLCCGISGPLWPPSLPADAAAIATPMPDLMSKYLCDTTWSDVGISFGTMGLVAIHAFKSLWNFDNMDSGTTYINGHVKKEPLLTDSKFIGGVGEGITSLGMFAHCAGAPAVPVIIAGMVISNAGTIMDIIKKG